MASVSQKCGNCKHFKRHKTKRYQGTCEPIKTATKMLCGNSEVEDGKVRTTYICGMWEGAEDVENC